MRGRIGELKTSGWYFLIALVAELFASRWAWESAPTDSLRALYEENFWAYELERLSPWLIGFALLSLLRIVKGKPTTYF